MALLENMLRSTAKVSRRAAGTPLVLERLAHVEGSLLDKLASGLERLAHDRFASARMSTPSLV